MSSKRSYSNDTRNQSFKKFSAEFDRQLPAHGTYRMAFNAAEENIGRCYSSYESFKVTRSQKSKKK